MPFIDINHFSAVEVLRNAGNTIKFTVMRERRDEEVCFLLIILEYHYIEF